MQFPYPITRVLRITNANGSTAIQIGPGPTETIYGSNGSQIVLDASGSYPTIFFWNAQHNNRSFINLYASDLSADANVEFSSGGFPSVRFPALTQCINTLRMGTSSRSIKIGPRIETGTQQYYAGNLFLNEQIASLAVSDNSGATLAQVSVVDTSSTGTQTPVTIAAVGGKGAYGLATGYQFGYSVADQWPVQWNNVTNWLDVQGWDWAALSLLNSWAAAATYLAPACKLMPDGVVQLSGSIKGGVTADNTQIFNLPFANIAPTASALLRPAVDVASGNARILVNGSGQAFCYGMAAGTQIGLDGLSFRCKRP